MTHIEFRTHLADKLHYTCRWVRKALMTAPDCKIVLFTEDRAQMTKLDEMLWTFADEAFLPHALCSDPLAARSPIVLAHAGSASLPHHHILVNLSQEVPACFAQFERLLEMVSVDENDTLAGRKKYTHYKQRGYALQHEVARS